TDCSRRHSEFDYGTCADPLARSSGRESKSGVGLQRHSRDSFGHRFGRDRWFFNPWSTVKTSSMDKFTNRQWSVILQLSDQSLPDLPSSDVPTIRDLTRDESQRMLLRNGAIAPNQFGKVYMLRDGVPAARAAVLETAFAKTFTDRNFLADVEKS